MRRPSGEQQLNLKIKPSSTPQNPCLPGSGLVSYYDHYTTGLPSKLFLSDLERFECVGEEVNDLRAATSTSHATTSLAESQLRLRLFDDF
jgi:hypothetical protein